MSEVRKNPGDHTPDVKGRLEATSSQGSSMDVLKGQAHAANQNSRDVAIPSNVDPRKFLQFEGQLRNNPNGAVRIKETKGKPAVSTLFPTESQQIAQKWKDENTTKK